MNFRRSASDPLDVVSRIQASLPYSEPAYEKDAKVFLPVAKIGFRAWLEDWNRLAINGREDELSLKAYLDKMVAYICNDQYLNLSISNFAAGSMANFIKFSEYDELRIYLENEQLAASAIALDVFGNVCNVDYLIATASAKESVRAESLDGLVGCGRLSDRYGVLCACPKPKLYQFFSAHGVQGSGVELGDIVLGLRGALVVATPRIDYSKISGQRHSYKTYIEYLKNLYSHFLLSSVNANLQNDICYINYFSWQLVETVQSGKKLVE